MTAAPPFPELQKASNQMNMGKAPGDDGVTTEMLRWAPGLLNLIFSPWFKDNTLTVPLDAIVNDWPREWLQAKLSRPI